MSLNPSCNLEEGHKGFPVIGDAPFDEIGKNFAIAELKEAGFPRGSDRVIVQEIEVYKKDSEAYKLAKNGIHIPSICEKSETEWTNGYTVKAELYGWTFYRAWYYWIAEAATKEFEIPKTLAQKFNKDENNRKEIRVEGWAGGNDVKKPVSSYHVDTPRGLKELVMFLRKIDELIAKSYGKVLRHKDRERFYELGYRVKWDFEFESYSVHRIDGDEAQGISCETLEDVEVWIEIDQKNRKTKIK